MHGIRLLKPPQFKAGGRLCGFLGSFDPFHHGHAWVTKAILKRFDAALLMVPASHFHKTVRYPQNARRSQRLAIMAAIFKSQGKVGLGLAREVLFLRLHHQLQAIFPGADIGFVMGNETFARFLDSRRYYQRLGLAWGEAEEKALAGLRKKVMVFGRSAKGPGTLPVPSGIRGISSTKVRETAARLWRENAREAEWNARLAECIGPEALELIRQAGLYVQKNDRHPD